uniref:UBP-type domain-containing protein n=3 Tax=Clastoptera arizonana TaxID=38151 RepID=A0A1B6DQI7_9HEMI
MEEERKKLTKKVYGLPRRSQRNPRNPGPSAALIAAKKNARIYAKKNPQTNDDFVRDVYETAQNSKNCIKQNTGIVYDELMIEHKCDWDTSHQERPERFTRILERCNELGLLTRCTKINSREATLEEISMKHTKELIDSLKTTDGNDNVLKLEEIASNYDAVYFNSKTYKLSLLAAGSTINLVDNICSDNIQNGMAIIRPPGHHAMESNHCGYCFFNNVAIAAECALRNWGLSRILIIDWDVHHGQATQQMFYNDPRVVYFSIHRYEYGTFWPNLRESDFDFIGEGKGKGFNFNVPLNEIGLSDADYLAIFQQVLLPMANEFRPELIIVSAGYDAAIGCPEGEMEITPACYAHLVTSLMPYANGKVAVVLEGGYCLQSLAEGAALTLRALLGDPCPNLQPLGPPSQSVQDSILNCIFSHRDYWQCYMYQDVYTPEQKQTGDKNQHSPIIQYNHTPVTIQKYPTRNTCPIQTQDKKDQIAERLTTLVKETKLLSSLHKVCLVYDLFMMEHRNFFDNSHCESPERISSVYEKHLEFGVIDRVHLLQSREANSGELLLVHEQTHLDDIFNLCNDFSEVKKKKLPYNSVYLNRESYKCASMAVGSLLQVVDSVLSGTSSSGVAIVRPPGHHAEVDAALGFCFFNTVSIGAKYAIKNYGLKRVLILDWDVHHGNGIQHIFEEDPTVLYISIHRFEKGKYFPGSDEAAETFVGTKAGVGYNVNIPWSKKSIGNSEYIAAFHQIVLPIAYQFNPELVLVSAGFDAAVQDVVGGCNVAPEAYAYFTHWLLPLAMGRLILCLEGGYNITSTSYAMTLCTKTLLGDPVPSLRNNLMRSEAVSDIKNVMKVQSKYWPALCFSKSLPLSLNSNELSKLDLAKECINIEEQFHKSLFVEEKSLCEKEVNMDKSAVDKPLLADTDQNKNSLSHTSSEDSSTSSASLSLSQFDLRPKSSQMENSNFLTNEEAFAVQPFRDCHHLSSVKSVPNSGIDLNSPCLDCYSTEKIWICLTCYSSFCWKHMSCHFSDSSHPLASQSFSKSAIWCYQCNATINHEDLTEAINVADFNKYGEKLHKK